ncbi:MAG TPA: sugar porter family MFS transporter [Cyclobacteriaceae bacterium]|nr:sugar porter family MFS transporter [Cyclobacteriaceae bacterium]
MNPKSGYSGDLLLFASVAALGGLLFGFDIAIITGAAPFIKEEFELGELKFGWTVSSLLWGCIIGAAVAGRITDIFGRKKILMVTALLFLLTSLSCGIAPGLNLLILSRIIGGVAVGAASILSPMYISEISPVRIRGRLVSMYQLSIVIGILLSYLINYLLHDSGDDIWRWMFLTGIIPSVAFFILLFLVPETPRFLSKAGRKEDALKVLIRVEGSDKAAAELARIEETLREGGSGFREILKPEFRKMVWVGLGLALFVQVSGINTIIDYAPIILRTAGLMIDAALFSTFIIGAVNFLFTLVSIWAIEKAGRRPLYIIGSAGMTLILLIITIANITGNFTGLPALLLILLYIAFFASCIGPVFWTLVAEIYPNRVRGTAMTIPVFTQWIANALVVMFFPWMLANTGGAFTFGTLALMAFLMLIFTLYLVPETKGKSLEDIEEGWKK